MVNLREYKKRKADPEGTGRPLLKRDQAGSLGLRSGRLRPINYGHMTLP